MTEPPEPRHPEEGGGESPQDEAERLAREQLERVHELEGNTDPVTDDEVQEYLQATAELRALLDSEWLDEAEDDMLIDRVGRGDDDRTIYDEFDEVEDELEDHLHDIKEQTEDEPIPELVSLDDAMKIIAEAKAERRKKADGPPGPRQTNEGNTGPVTATEDAAKLRALGAQTYESILGAINAVSEALETAKGAYAQVPVTAREGYGAAAHILGEGHANLNDINGATAALEELITPMQGQVAELRQQCNDLQRQAAVVADTYNDAAGAIGGGS